MASWTTEECEREVNKTLSIVRVINEQIGQGVDARAIMSQLATCMVQLEAQIDRQYPGRMPASEHFLSTARVVLAKSEA